MGVSWWAFVSAAKPEPTIFRVGLLDLKRRRRSMERSNQPLRGVEGGGGCGEILIWILRSKIVLAYLIAPIDVPIYAMHMIELPICAQHSRLVIAGVVQFGVDFRRVTNRRSPATPSS